MSISNHDKYWAAPTVIGFIIGLIIVFFRWLPENKSEHPNHSYHSVIKNALPFSVSIFSFQKNQSSTIEQLSTDPILSKYITPDHQQQTSLGSGILITQDGWVVTNAHVVKSADNVVVQTHKNQLSNVSKILIDPETDIAVLKTDLRTSRLVSTVDPIEERVGDLVFSLGNPYGIGQSASMGIISAQRRSQPSLTTLSDFIQTDATINPGNSGGALIDASGQVIGMNTAIFSSSGGSQGVGFAIPFDFVMEIANQLIQNGEINRGFLGIDAETTAINADYMGDHFNQGLVVISVQPNSPAELAGIQVNDIIIELAGMRISKRDEAARHISRLMPGKELTISLIRQGRVVELKTTLTLKSKQ